ncbi:MAG: hypothetical protein KAT65_30335 [Methanophagales archaeon]|nr:hypothetical protein [Methanophagales archaeon]
MKIIIRNEASMSIFSHSPTHQLTNSSTHPLIGRVASLHEVGTGFILGW